MASESIANAHELGTRENGVWEEAFPQAGQDFSLPPADRGRRAWSFLAVCFILEALVWGFPFSFGVFEKYYATHAPFSDASSGIAAIGTTATGIMYFSAPLVFYVIDQYPHRSRQLSMAGLVVILIGLVASSFANRVWQLILTQGALYGIGGVCHYFPAIVYVDEWFVQRKSLAFGIMWAGSGSSGIVVPVLMEALLSKYGFRTALRAWAVAMAVLSIPSVLYLRGRLPIPGTSLRRRQDYSYFKTTTFWCLQIANIFQGLGYFIPPIYLPTYARDIGLSNASGTVSLSLINASAVMGTIGIGWLADKVQATTGMLLCSVCASSAIFLLWGFSLSAATLYIFALVYGAFAGGYTATWTAVARLLQKQCADERGVSRMETGTVMAFFAAGKGIGAVVSGPLSEKLLEIDSWKGQLGGAFGTGYGSLVVWSGVAMLLGGVGWFGQQVGLV